MYKISIMTIIFIVISLCSAGQFNSLEGSEPQAYETGQIPSTTVYPCYLVDWKYENPLGGSLNETFCTGSRTARGYLFPGCDMATSGSPSKASNTLIRPSSMGNTSNVIVSEPVNCADGTDPLGVCALHAQNFSGHNISIAIIDFEYYADRLSQRELPVNRIPLFNGTFSERSRHGTACAEIIGDTAPNVTLYMIGLDELSEAGFKEAVEKLNRLDRRIDIVSSSIDFTFGLFDEGDSICRAVRNLTENGTIWVTAAGDDARQHWRGTFLDENDNGFNEFGKGDESLNLAAERGNLLEVRLSWNDSWSQASQDYDLYVFSPDGTYAISKNPQEGYDGQEPVERVDMIAPVSGNYSIKIRKYSASNDDVSFQLFASHDLLKYNISNSSLGALASCPEVITIGAVDASTMQLENFSSMGPTIDGRLKPDLVAPDNVTTASYLPKRFTGSSASAPYAAGIFALALEKGRKLGMTDEEIVQFLLNSAIDLGPKGPENEYGYGLINLKSFAEL